MADVSISSWTRLEPRSQSADPSVGLSAQLADPLWMLARQWQLAEFVGDDGATPVRARVRVGWSPITRWHAGAIPDGGIDGQSFNPAVAPLEAMVEAEFAAPGFRGAAEAGRRIEGQLHAAGLDTVLRSIRGLFALAAPAATDITDDANDTLVAMLAGRVVDGRALRSAVSGGVLPAGVDSGADDAVAAAGILQQWAAWWDARWPPIEPDAGPPPASWVPDRLEYRFAVAAPLPKGGEVVLQSPEYHGDGLDWDDLDVAPAGRTLGAAADTARLPADVLMTTTLPQPVRWPGAPADRFWELEDASVNLGQLDAWPTDLATMLAAEFCLIGSTDWFTLPMTLPVGSVAWLESVVVDDTFGDSMLVATMPGEVGRLFEAAPSTTARPAAGERRFLVLPPTVVGGVQGTAIEDVALLRDQLANLCWAVERTAPGPAGLPVDVAAALARRPATPAAQGPLRESDVRYRLAVLPPDNWVPLTPVLRVDGDRRSTRLARTRVVGGGEPTPATQLVREVGELAEEEVPREGRRIRLGRQRARWVDGSTWVWTGRMTGPGKGEGRSGLRFDSLDKP